MTKTDESPEEATEPHWSDELLAVLAEALGDEDRARQTLEDIIQQAQEGKAMQTPSTERLASHLTELYNCGSFYEGQAGSQGIRNAGAFSHARTVLARENRSRRHPNLPKILRCSFCAPLFSHISQYRTVLAHI